MQTHYLMLVQNPDDDSWMLMVDTTDKSVFDREFEARKDSNVIGIDTSNYVTFA